MKKLVHGYANDYFWAFTWFVITAAVLYLWAEFDFAHTALAAGVASISIFVGFLYLRSAKRRRYGIKVERDAIASLKSNMDASKGDRLIIGKMTPYGDVDAFLVINGRKFSVEIKSWRKFDSGTLRDKNALLQAFRIAKCVGATPVLYFPLSRTCSRYVGNVLVIGGTTKTLISYLKAL